MSPFLRRQTCVFNQSSSVRNLLADQLVSAETVTDEWLDVTVDLSKYAGSQVQLRIENRANDWRNEWAYWHTVKVVTRP